MKAVENFQAINFTILVLLGCDLFHSSTEVLQSRVVHRSLAVTARSSLPSVQSVFLVHDIYDLS